MKKRLKLSFEEISVAEMMETNGGGMIAPNLGPYIIAQYVIPWIVSHIN